MCAWSPAKLHRLSVPVPETWDELLRLASERPGVVVQPFSRMTTTALFFSLSVSLSDKGPRRLDSGSFAQALHLLERLFTASHGGHGFQLGSIDALKLAMQGQNRMALVPFAYPYSCFARTDVVGQALQYRAHAKLPSRSAWHGVLGGAGIAVSATSASRAQALELLLWLTSSECQSTFFGVCLGPHSTATE